MTNPSTPRTPAQKSAIRKYLMDNYARAPWPEILEATGCSKATVYHFACEMGLKRPAHRTKDQQFTLGAARVAKEHVAPSKSLKPVLNSTVDPKKCPYAGAELLPFDARPGAMDAFALPSRWFNQRVYRDGRVEGVA